jgi:hypothetical protein
MLDMVRWMLATAARFARYGINAVRLHKFSFARCDSDPQPIRGSGRGRL